MGKQDMEVKPEEEDITEYIINTNPGNNVSLRIKRNKLSN